MRHLAAILLACCALAAHAQNWALLNPAYRYNYSNDGTDTISNQIRVMQVDTLGPDSFRYELNRIGVVCDTCPASLGGPCDGCYVRVNQPQFLGFDCIQAGNDWFFFGPDTFLIRSAASVGTSWTFDASAGISATVDAEWPDSSFSMADTLQRILLSSTDTLLISQAYGILLFTHGDARYDLLGVEGAGVGRLLPDPMAYFDYHVGDELTYHVTSYYEVDPQGFFPYPSSFSHYWMVRITGRYQVPDTINYSTSIARTYADPPPNSIMSLLDEPAWPIPYGHWSFNRNDVLFAHPILAAFPGEVLDTSICDVNPWPDSDLRYLAQRGTSSAGRSIVFAQVLGNAYGSPSAGFSFDQEVLPDLHPLNADAQLNVLYEKGIGLRKVRSRPSSWSSERSVELVGAIISGDTIIPPPAINWQVGLPEEHFSGITLFPNPAADAFTVNGITGVKTLAIHDLEGRSIRTARITSKNETISVQDLQPGSYLLRIDGHRPHRFIIAR